MLVLRVFVVYVIMFINVYCSAFTDNLYAGSPCKVDNKPGICTALHKCPEENERVTTLKQDPRVKCSFEGEVQIVCCELPAVNGTMELYVNNRSGTAELHACTFDGRLPVRCCPSEQVFTPPLQDEACPPAPLLQQTGNVARDKCARYAALARPCVRRRGALERRAVCAAQRLGDRITNGVPAVFAEFPHMVILGYQQGGDFEWLNGGSLISETFVLTAAHAIVISRDGSSVERVCVGLLKSSKACREQTAYGVKNKIIHEEYDFGKYYNDIALLELEKPVILNQYVRPACLPFTKYDKPIANLMVIGWGYTDSTVATISENLLKTSVQEFNTSNCAANFAGQARWNRGWLPDVLLCAGSSNKSDSCRGDSGGPLMVYTPDKPLTACSYELVGVVSTGPVTCGIPGRPAVYTRVSGYIDWIVSKVWPDGD